MKNDFLSRYGVSLLPTSFLLIVFALFFFPVLFEGDTFFFRDVFLYAYPLKWYMAQVWAKGEWPFWHHTVLQGMPLMSLMHPGVFYPPSALFLLKDFSFAFNAYFLFHHLILMGSVYALCRYWGRSVTASTTAALTALLGGYFLSLASIYNHFQSAVWFPLLLMMWQKFIDTGRIKYFCCAAIFLVLQMLGGGPENTIFSVLLIYVHSLYLKQDRERLSGYKRKSLVMLALGSISASLSAVQLIPTYKLLPELGRGEGIDYISSTRWSLEPSTLLDFFLPKNFTDFMTRSGEQLDYFFPSLYMGVVPAFLMLACLLVGREQKVIRFWLMVFGVGVFFALGRFNPLYVFFHEWVPGFDMFRYPQKFFFFCAYALVFLSAFVLDRFIQAIEQSSQETKFFFLALLVTAVGVIGLLADQPGRAGAESLMILFVLAASTIALHLKKIHRSVFMGLLILLMVMDLMGKNSMLVPMIDKRFYSDRPPLARQLGGTADSARIFSGKFPGKSGRKNLPLSFVGDEEVQPGKKLFGYNLLGIQLAMRDRLYPNIGTIYGLAYAEGYSGLTVKRIKRWLSEFNFSEANKQAIILERSNVKYWVTEEFDQLPSEQYPRGIKKVKVFEDALPRAFLVGESRQVPEAELLDVYYDPAFDPLQKVLLTEPVELKKEKQFSGQVEKIVYSPNRVTMKTNQNEEGFLVLLDTYFPGWKVEVDGKTEHIYRANYFYRGVRLAPGSHSIEFTYEPVGLKTGVIISGVTCILLLFLFFKPVRVKQ